MKNKFQYLLLFLTMLASQSACKKIFEHIPKPEPPKNDYTQCRVSKITGSWYAGFDQNDAEEAYFTGTVIFRYNAAGNPVSMGTTDSIVTNTHSWLNGSASLPYRLFRYDKQNRLTDLIEPVNPNLSMDRGYRTWHRYAYDNANKIIRDSIYGSGSEVNGRPSNPAYSIDTFTYDAQARIIGPSYYYFFQGAGYYDSRGNYAFVDSIPYPYDTTAVNPLQTNKVWQFLAKNHSKNVYRFTFDDSNPYFSKYNDCKLPTYFNDGAFSVGPSDYWRSSPYTGLYWTNLFTLDWYEMNIEYECSCDCESTSAKIK